MIVIVCGDRNWRDRKRLNAVLDAVRPKKVIEGRAPGADRQGGAWADENIGKKNHLKYPANWNEYGKAAGPLRNSQMLQRLLEEPMAQAVIAFHDDFNNSKGTKDMFGKALRAQVPVLLVGPGRQWTVYSAPGSISNQLVTAARLALGGPPRA